MQFTVTVAGVTMENRQKVLEWAKNNEVKTAYLVRDKDNKYDKNAIAVLIPHITGRKQIGYIPNRANCLVCDPQQKGHGIPSYQVEDIGSYVCPDCGNKGTLDPGTADKIAKYLDNEVYCRAKIIKYVGGEDGKPTKGVVLDVYVES